MLTGRTKITKEKTMKETETSAAGHRCGGIATAFRTALLAAAWILVAGTACAHFPVGVRASEDDGLLRVPWTPVQVGLCSRIPTQLVPGSADVYGMSAGLVMLEQKSSVVSVAHSNGLQKNYFAQVGLVSACEENCALECGVFVITGRNYGISAGALNLQANFGEGLDCSNSWLSGLQLGLLNAGGGIQAGLLNYNPKGFLPWFPLFNFPL